MKVAHIKNLSCPGCKLSSISYAALFDFLQVSKTLFTRKGALLGIISMLSCIGFPVASGIRFGSCSTAVALPTSQWRRRIANEIQSQIGKPHCWLLSNCHRRERYITHLLGAINSEYRVLVFQAKGVKTGVQDAECSFLGGYLLPNGNLSGKS